METMNITVNGEARTLAEPVTVQQYLESLALAGAGSGIAVVHNGEVVRRADWPRVLLAEADELEIVRATMGG